MRAVLAGAGWALVVSGVFAGPGVAAVRTVCGVRDGTAGNASLVAHGQDVLVLASAVGTQTLLEEADRRVGPQPRNESGTQNGARYCLRVRYDRSGRPAAILAGWRVR